MIKVSELPDAEVRKIVEIGQVVKSDDLKKCLEAQKQNHQPLGVILIEQGLLTETQLLMIVEVDRRKESKSHPTLEVLDRIFLGVAKKLRLD